MVPLPTKFVLNFGTPLHFEGDHDASDAEVSDKVEVVKDALAELIARGRSQRQGVFAR